MILIQVLTDTLTSNASSNSSGHSFWFYLEIMLIIAVIIYQLYHSRKVFLSIEELKGIFNNPIFIKNGFIEKDNLINKKDKSFEDIVFFEEDNENDDDLSSDQDSVKISVATTEGKGIIKQICEDINNYLLNNYGADVNFANIKDIIDRHIEVKDNEISNSVTTPLYLGLAATMIGIIFGLLAVPNLSGDGFSEGIAALIDGVKFAMTASFVGLVSTTYLSVIKYKNANKKLLESKNKQISYLQAKLLPALIDANQTGLTGLKTQIEQFSRDAFTISTNLKDTISKTSSNIEKFENIIKNQLEIIQKIENINVTKVSRTNLELLDRLERNIQSFNQFAEYLEVMGQISEQLKDFASRTANIDNIINRIDTSLSDNTRLIEFLSEHFNRIEQAGNNALRAVNVADAHFQRAVETLTQNSNVYFNNLLESIRNSSTEFNRAVEELIREINNRINNINQTAANHESELQEIYNEIGNNLKEITQEHLRQLETSYREAIPKFEELKHLTELPAIREQFINNSNGKKFIELVEELNESLRKIKENNNQNELLKKLDSINETLTRKKLEKAKTPGSPREPLMNKQKEKPVSNNLFKVIGKLFRKKGNHVE